MAQSLAEMLTSRAQKITERTNKQAELDALNSDIVQLRQEQRVNELKFVFLRALQAPQIYSFSEANPTQQESQWAAQWWSSNTHQWTIGELIPLIDHFSNLYYQFKGQADSLSTQVTPLTTQISTLTAEINQLNTNIKTIQNGIANLQSQGISPEQAGEIVMAQFDSDQRKARIFNALKVAAILLAIAIVIGLAYMYFKNKKVIA